MTKLDLLEANKIYDSIIQTNKDLGKNLLDAETYSFAKKFIEERDVSEEIKKYTRKIKGVKFQVKEFETVKSKERRYAARFEYGGTGYYLMGVMPRRDFNNILKNLHFFEK